MTRSLIALGTALVLTLAACAPATGPSSDAAMAALDAPCVSEPPPVVAVMQFDNTTGRYGTTVTGVEEAATARLITLLKESGCYEIVEQSELQNVMMQQGLESMEPEALARAAGAGYVVTVTRATIAEPGVSVFGFSLGETRADVEVDVRATDIITGTIVVFETGTGSASSPNIAVDRIPTGRISYDDPTVGPILADASAAAVREVVAFLRVEF